MKELFVQRELGVLLHLSSLCTKEPIGTLGRSAYDFVDWLETTGSTIWQILPLSPNGKYRSPYFSPSSFCGNPWLIDLEDLVQAGLLDGSTITGQINDDRVSYKKLEKWKQPLLISAAKKMMSSRSHPWQKGYEEFHDKHTWLDDTAMFYVLKNQYQNKPWWEWPREARLCDPSLMEAVRKEKSEELQLHKTIFYFFDKQWEPLKAYANSKGIRVLGDLAIYVDEDSAEVWLNQKFFKLDEEGQMKVVSGVPPDFFSETGQLWGNPIYDWKAIEADDFSWWRARLNRVLEMTDLVRIDHFRGLSAYWEVPQGAADAREGSWVEGPGQKFFDSIRKDQPEMPIVVEDLGILDDDVYELRDSNNFYGMRVLQWGFDGDPNNHHLPHMFPKESLVYPGNHDNLPMAAWWDTLSEDEKKRASKYYGLDINLKGDDVVWSLVEVALECKSQVAVISMQDLLVLDGNHRMNNPATFEGNWRWRMPLNMLTPELAAKLKELKLKHKR